MELFPYQEEGALFLSARKHALLADEMGLGKSAQAIRACDLVRAIRILVICPAIAKYNWAAEFKQFSHRRRVIEVIDRADGYHPIADGVQVISYDLIPRLKTQITSQFWNVIIADESHYLKNGKALRTIAAYGKPPKTTGLIDFTSYFWCLSGTPMPNNNTELQPMFRAFGKTQLNLPGWLDRYNFWKQTPFGPKITGQKGQKELKDLLETFCIRRKKEEVMKELPPLLYGVTTVEPGVVDVDIWFWDKRKEIYDELKVERTVYEHLVTSYRKKPDQLFDAIEAAKKSMPTLRRYTGLQKVDPTLKMVDEMLDSGIKKIVIFAIHKEVIKTLQAMLQTKYKVLTIWGATPAEKRAKIVRKFQEQACCKIFIGQIQAAGTAITLTAAHHMLFVEQSWVPAENAQAAMRCHRVGQTKPVNVQFITLPDSIDQKITMALKNKTEMISQLFE